MLFAHGVTPMVWDLSEDRRRIVEERIGARDADSLGMRSRVDAVITVTPGAEVLYEEGSLDYGHVSLMGADGPGKAEIATAELSLAAALLRRLGASEPRRRAGRRRRGGGGLPRA